MQRHQEAIAIGIEEHLLVTVERREEQRGVTLTLTISADFAKSTFLPFLVANALPPRRWANNAYETVSRNVLTYH